MSVHPITWACTLEHNEEADEGDKGDDEESTGKEKGRKKDEKKNEDDVSESLLQISWACTVGSCQVLFVNVTSPQPLSSLFLFYCLHFLVFSPTFFYF